MLSPDIRWMTPSQFLTRAEMVRALSLYAETYAEGRSDFAQRFAEEVVCPNLQRITRSLGQDVDPLYLAQAVESALTEVVKEVKAAGAPFPTR